MANNASVMVDMIDPTPSNQPAQMKGLDGYDVTPIFTIGEIFEDGSQGDYFPPGILDGLGAYTLEDGNTIRVLANHELTSSSGYAYTLANGTELTGARVSFFDIDKYSLELVDVGLAYDTIINRAGEIVDEASDLEFGGINRLCSAQYIEAYQFGNGIGLHDGMFFTGEEGYGGTEFVLDVATNTMYAVPWMGRAAWESVTEINTGDTEKVALLVGDDRQAAPLLLYLGNKGDINGDGNIDFLERNGLAGGELYVWVANSGEITPEEFNGTGEDRDGTFVKIKHYDLDQAGSAVDTDGDGSIQDEMGYDEQGFATQAQQDFLAEEAGAFKFSRPEDVATNPIDGTEIVLASTGRGGLFPSDNWGTTYRIDVDFGSEITVNAEILYDGDDAGNGQFAGPDYGLRSPDNLDWADDGMIYIQEDRSTSPSSLFGGTSGKEASIWKLDPDSGILTRVAKMDRSAVPEGQTDSDPDDIGDWESSGILDVSTLFEEAPGTRFIFDVQAHSLRDGIIETENLVQGGQLAFLTVQPELVGYAELSADTFAEGPPSGNFINSNNRETPFDSQPVQGFSSVQFATKDSYWFLSDNGFGAKSNSADYLLRIYKVDPDFVGTEEGDGTVEVQDFIQLSDPNNLLPFDIVNENTSDRLLTGADFDIESFVIAENGTIWIGDEFGPFLLHFNSDGVLLDIPISTPNITNLNTLEGQDQDPITSEYVQSPDNPFLEDAQDANLPRSRGFEGTGSSPDGSTLYPMLEGTVKGDPEGSLRIYEFDLITQSYSDELAGLYQLAAPNHAIGDLTPINNTEFLVIERDGGQGETAMFKKIFKIDISNLDENGFVEKKLVVDLLNIADSNDLNSDGKTTFAFPFVTIEDVLIIDEETILVANDNNYPFSIGRPETEDIDNTEIIQIKLPTPLDLDDRLGVDNAPEEEEVISLPKVVTGTPGDDYFDSAFPDDQQFVGDEQTLFTGSGDDMVDASQIGEGNRIDLGSGDDWAFIGTNNRVIAGAGDDLLFAGAGEGNNQITTGSGYDQVWLITDIDAIPEGINLISDFDSDYDLIGFANTGLTMADKGTDWNYQQSGNNVIISAFEQEIAQLNNTTVTDANFIFA